IVEWLNLGRIDCALVYNALGSPTLDLQPLLDEQLFLVAPLPARGARKARKSVTLAELADYPLNIPSRPHAMRMSVESALASVDVKIKVAHEIECIPAIIDLVRQGHGYAVLPLNAVKSTPWSDEVLVKPILAPILRTSLSIATSAQRPRSPLLRKAIDVVRDVVRQEIRSAEDPA
ncbi:MAG TPA: LysR substrate-binding domain-containing protein, partial [Steroidobacteraceae bacterium]|nr:LysR substrate-binding domain-containing protein [Steroidobacteraceae bacterium]